MPGLGCKIGVFPTSYLEHDDIRLGAAGSVAQFRDVGNDRVALRVVAVPAHVEAILTWGLDAQLVTHGRPVADHPPDEIRSRQTRQLRVRFALMIEQLIQQAYRPAYLGLVEHTQSPKDAEGLTQGSLGLGQLSLFAKRPAKIETGEGQLLVHTTACLFSRGKMVARQGLGCLHLA